MLLDFTALDQLGRVTPSEAPGSPEGPQEAPGADTATKRRQNGEDGASEEGMNKATARSLLEPYEDAKRYKEMIREQAQAIQDAGDLRTDIAKGINSKEDPLDLLLKAVKCISLMTGERSYYEILAGKAEEAYRDRKPEA